MMRPSLIFLNNPKSYYYPGDVVRGLCVVEDAKTPICKLVVRIKGLCKVSWTRQKKANTTFYNIERSIIVDRIGRDHGVQCWPFAMELDDGLPPTFLGVYGETVYIIRADMVNKGGSVFCSCTEPLVLKSNVSLSDEMYNSPVRSHLEENVKRLLFTSGSIVIDVTTDRSSYCQNDFVILNGVISNKSNHPLTMSISLLQEQIFRTGNQSRKAEQVRSMPVIKNAACVSSLIGKRQERKIEDVHLLLVSHSPSFMSNFIDVNYMLEIQVKSRWVRPVASRLPLVITSVPMRHRQQLFDETVRGLHYTAIEHYEVSEESESTHHPLPGAIEEDGIEEYGSDEFVDEDGNRDSRSSQPPPPPANMIAENAENAENEEKEQQNDDCDDYEKPVTTNQPDEKSEEKQKQDD